MREFLEKEFKRNPQDYKNACRNLKNTIRKLEAASENNYILLVPYTNHPPLEPSAFSKGLASLIEDKSDFKTKNVPPLHSKNDLNKLQPVLKDIIETEGKPRYIIFCNKELLGEIKSHQGMEFLTDYISDPITITDDTQNIKRFIRDLSETEVSKDFEGSIAHLPDLQFYVIANTLSDKTISIEELSRLRSSNGDIFLTYTSYVEWVEPLKSLYLQFLEITEQDLDIASYIKSRKALYNALTYRKFKKTNSEQINDCFCFKKFNSISSYGEEYLEFLQRLAVESAYMRHPYIQIEDSFSSKSEQQEVRHLFEEVTNSSFSMTDMSKNGEAISKYVVEILAGNNPKEALDIAFRSSIVNRKLKTQVDDRIEQEGQPKEILNSINKILAILRMSQIIRYEVDEEFIKELTTTDEFNQRIKIVLQKNIEKRNNLAIDRFEKLAQSLDQSNLIDLLDESRSSAKLESKKQELEELDTNIDGLDNFLKNWYTEVIRRDDSPFTATLSEKYLEMNQWLMEEYREINLDKTNDLIGKISKERGVKIVLVIDGFGYNDGLHLKNSPKFNHTISDMDKMLSVLPTLTPCAMPSLVTGYSPEELGILSKDVVYGNRQFSMFENTSTLLKDAFEDLEKVNNVQYLITESLENTSITEVTECCAKIEKISFSKANSERQYRENIVDKIGAALENHLNGDSNTIIVYSSDLEDVIHGPDTLISEEFHNLQAKFINRIISDIDQVREKLSIENIEIIVTGDHGKITIDEKNTIEENETIDWPGKKDIEDKVISQLKADRKLDFKDSSNGTGRFYAEWFETDESKINEVKRYLGEIKDADAYVGDEVINFFNKPLSKLSPPSLIVTSRYSYDKESKNPSFSAHGGTSISEIIVPAVKVNLTGDTNE